MIFRIKDSSDSQFFFTAYGDNGEPLCHSETYTTKQSALRTIAVIKAEAPDARVIDDTDSENANAVIRAILDRYQRKR